MRAPVRPISGRWPAALERRLRRFFRNDPSVLTRPAVTDEQFRTAMSAIHVGDTIKITGTNRHPVADDMLLRNVDLADRTMVDIGASDGSTALDLIAKMPAFRHYVIADLYMSLSYVKTEHHVVFYAPDGESILVVGRRVVAWPSLSPTIRRLYRPVLSAAQRLAGDRKELLLLNPAVRRVMEQDRRISFRVHDVFTVWEGDRPDVIKIANLLRRLYFSDADITRALRAVHASLAADGHLLIVDNPRIPGIGARAGLYRRTDHGFDVVEESAEIPEISGLVRALRTESDSVA